MPVGTLELPLQMIDVAKGFAARENVTVCDLFAQLLHSRYGVEFTFAYTVPEQHQTHKRIQVPESVKSISGVIQLPVGMSENDVVYDAVMSV